MTKAVVLLVLGSLIGGFLGYTSAVGPLDQAKREAVRARAQVALYYCVAADLEAIIQKDHPDWRWWDAVRRPQVDCDAVFEYFYAENITPAKMAWLDTAP